MSALLTDYRIVNIVKDDIINLDPDKINFEGRNEIKR